MRDVVKDEQTVASISASVQQGDLGAAFAAAEAALADGLEHPLPYRLRGIRAEGEGRLIEAVQAFDIARQMEPAHAPTLGALGLCLARVGQLDAAKAILHDALALEPDYADAHFALGWALENQNDADAAVAAYEQAVRHAPTHIAAHANAAVLAARRGEIDKARSLANAALALESRDATAVVALATADLAERKGAEAEARIRKRLGSSARMPPSTQATLQGLLGDSLHQQQQPAAAFDAWLLANVQLRMMHGVRFGPGRLEPGADLVQRLAGAFSEAQRARWQRAIPPPPPVASPVARHSFVVGFPRSGATLVAQVLGSHPAVTLLDGWETLAEPAHEYLSSDDGLTRLARLTDDQLAAERDAYWQRVQAKVPTLTGEVFLDKLPINLLALPIIDKLFPDARILLVRRDPRDVVLSCFRHPFGINPTTWEFLALESTAKFYAQVMALTERYLDLLGLTVQIQRYEDLIDDVDTASQSLCRFLGLEWTPALRDVAARSKQRAADSGQWRAYAQQLAPVLPILQPWIAKYGYPAD